MKIYFGFTVAGDRSSLTTAARIVELLEELGHEVLTRHLIREDAWQADRSVSPQEVYRRDLNWLQQCDLFVAEVSGSSLGWASRPVTFWARQPRKCLYSIGGTWKRRSPF